MKSPAKPGGKQRYDSTTNHPLSRRNVGKPRGERIAQVLFLLISPLDDLKLYSHVAVTPYSLSRTAEKPALCTALDATLSLARHPLTATGSAHVLAL